MSKTIIKAYSDAAGVAIGATDLNLNNLTVTNDLTVDTDTLFVDASENKVGIGNTTPNHLLSVGDDLGLITTNKTITLGDSSGNVGLFLGNDGDNYSAIQWRTSEKGLSFQTRDSATTYSNTMFLRQGNVGIGTTSPGAILDVQDSNLSGVIARFGDSGSSARFTVNSGGQVFAGTGPDVINLFRTAPASVTGASFCMSTSSSAMPTGITTGTLTPIQWHSTTGAFVRSVSSLRYKENISDINVGLDLITQLRPVKYNRKGNPDTEYGLIAEEVHQVAPELVTYLEEEIDGLKEFEFKAIFVKAIQELKAENDELKARIEVLESN